MDIKTQVIQEYLETEVGYRKQASKYGVSQTTINKWVMIHQGVHNICANTKQQQPTNQIWAISLNLGLKAQETS